VGAGAHGKGARRLAGAGQGLRPARGGLLQQRHVPLGAGEDLAEGGEEVPVDLHVGVVALADAEQAGAPGEERGVGRLVAAVEEVPAQGADLHGLSIRRLKRSFLTGEELGAFELRSLLDRALELKEGRTEGVGGDALSGRSVALVFALIMAFPIGVAGGLHPHGWQNSLAFGVQSLFVSIPNFWLAIVLVLFLSVRLEWLPALGYKGFSYVLLPAFDEKRPASVSPVIMGEVIRELIGLTGLVMSDDIGMKALGGSMGERAGAVIDAGCDVALHCSGDFGEMREVARAPWQANGVAILHRLPADFRFFVLVQSLVASAQASTRSPS